MDKKKVAARPQVQLKKALKIYGSRKALAEFLQISPEAIMNWQRKGLIYVPEHRALQISLDKPEACDKRRKQ
jgi:DNA-binding transcriptional regulator YdaS (Cro superfamily)